MNWPLISVVDYDIWIQNSALNMMLLEIILLIVETKGIGNEIFLYEDFVIECKHPEI